jgi:glyoxylate/succinic semialdehyde reductase
MRLALALGDELAQEMPVAAAANEMYKTARRLGKGAGLSHSPRERRPD